LIVRYGETERDPETDTKKDTDRNTDEGIDIENAFRDIQTINKGQQTMCRISY